MNPGKENIPLKINPELGRSIFGTNAQAYHQARPGYPARVFEILQTTCGADVDVFEIGPGTGQATEPLLDYGCRVTAIEPDERLAAFLDVRLKKHAARLTIDRHPFEDIELPAGSFELGIAAMSLHWLSPEIALAKAFRLLRSGGKWAMWWTVFGDPDDMDDFQRQTQSLFKKIGAQSFTPVAGWTPFALERDKRLAELEKASFTETVYEKVRWSPVLSTRQVLELTATFSPVARLPEIERVCFLDDIARIAEREFNGSVRRNFVTAIYTAHKP
ncbi:class I SAM-dependent methyltransferase [Phyllobacterium phragmitis]|nr:class I SAM-dependent methyltransferase [Phyllobacterium phragmitis]